MSATTMTVNPVTSKIVQPVTANADMPGKVSKFMHYKNDLIGFAKRIGLLGAGTVRNATSVLQRSGATLAAASILSTKTGYALAVGATELLAGAAASATIGVIHGANQVIGFSIWLASFPAGWVSKDAGDKVKKFGYDLTGEIAKFADTVLAGFNHITNRTVKVLNEPATQKMVMYSSLTIGIGVLANAISQGRIANAASSIPKVGKPLASVLRGGKATWIALGCVLAAAVGYSVGKAFVESVAESADKKTDPLKSENPTQQTQQTQRRRERNNRHVAA